MVIGKTLFYTWHLHKELRPLVTLMANINQFKLKKSQHNLNIRTESNVIEMDRCNFICHIQDVKTKGVIVLTNYQKNLYPDWLNII